MGYDLTGKRTHFSKKFTTWSFSWSCKKRRKARTVTVLIGTTKATVFFGYLIGIFLPLYIKRKFSTSKNSVGLVFVQRVLSNQVLNAMNVNFNLWALKLQLFVNSMGLKMIWNMIKIILGENSSVTKNKLSSHPEITRTIIIINCL